MRERLGQRPRDVGRLWGKDLVALEDRMLEHVCVSVSCTGNS